MATRFIVPVQSEEIRLFYNDWKMTSAQRRRGVELTAKKNKGAEGGLLVIIEVHRNERAVEFIRHSLFGLEGALTARGWRAEEVPPHLG